MTVVEHPYGWQEWRIKNNSHEYRKVDVYKIEFDIPVKKDDEAVLTYTIEY